MRKTKKFAAILLSALILSSSFSVLPVNAATIERNNQVVSSDQVIKTNYFMYSIIDNENIKIEKYIGNEKQLLYLILLKIKASNLQEIMHFVTV